MLCEEGDPMFTALVTAAGGLNMRTLAANIKNKPPDEIMASMGKGDGDSGLSEDDWDELVALGPYLSWAWNYWGPQADRSNPMDYYTWLTRENFDIFLEEFNDVEIRDNYNVKEARGNRDRRLDKERREKEIRIELDEYRAACQQRKKDRQIQSEQREKERNRRRERYRGGNSRRRSRKEQDNKLHTRQPPLDDNDNKTT